MEHVIDFATHMVEAIEDTPSRIIKGAPQCTTHIVSEQDDGRLVAGRWTATPGAWHVRYDEWEYCTILSGAGTLTSTDGTSMTLSPGVRFAIEPGFEGVFEVTQTLSKDFVILLPEPPNDP